MKKVFFVILHYQNKQDTINCIDSIDKLKNKDLADINIIVIDNNSPNNSGIELQEKYKNRNDIKCILLDKNYGFSKANNIGYKYAKENGANIIAVINNDILFEDNEFLSKLLEIKEESDIIAPDIINKDNMHQNPLKNEPYGIKKAYKNMIFELLSFLIYHIPFIRCIFYKYNSKRQEKWMKNYYSKNNVKFDVHNFVPFGAFIIYLESWIKKEDIAFASDTFMYCEEDMLSLYLKRKDYKILYCDDLKIKHLEGMSTKESNKNLYKLLKFRSKNKYKALKKYIIFYNKMKKEEI